MDSDGRYRVIDIDGHVEPALACDWTKYVRAPFGGLVQRLAEERFDRLGHMTSTRPGAWDPAVRIQDMDREGIDSVVLFGSAMGFSTSAESVGDLFEYNFDFGEADLSQFGLALAEGYNDWLHDYCSHNPERLKAAALVPLENIDDACREARRACGELGAVGVLTIPTFKKFTLDSSYFFPLYEAAEALDVPMLVHGGGLPGSHERYRTHFRLHAVNFPFTLIMGTMDVVCGGLLGKFGKLRIAFLEGGVGWVPWWMDRLDEHFEKLPHHVPYISEKPETLIKRYVEEGRLYWSCEADERHLPYAVDVLGDRCFLYASDYPHWDSISPHSVAAIADRETLDFESKRKILGENAARLLGRV